MDHSGTRRTLLRWFSGCVATTLSPAISRCQTLPRVGDFVRFADPITETPVVRLTNPAYRHILPPAHNRALPVKSNILFCSSDRASGNLQPALIDLRTGTTRPVAETDRLDPASLAIDAGGKSVFFLDGGVLSEASVNLHRENRKPQQLVSQVSAFGVGSSRAQLFFIREAKLEQLKGQREAVLAEAAEGPCLVRPGGRGCLFCRTGGSEGMEYWYASAGENTAPFKLASGSISNPFWSADGASLLFLRAVPQNRVSIATICEVNMETRVERPLTKTSQFASFASNANDSVFVGASSSKAQPNILLLLSVTDRELTLCEHRASNPAMPQPVFSPDSRRIFFQSDREGKSAIYAVNLDRLIEPTNPRDV